LGGSSIAVHGFKFSSQNEYLLKYYKFCPRYHITKQPFCKGGKTVCISKIWHLHKNTGGKLYSL